MAGLGIALRGIRQSCKKGISKINNMSDKTAGTITMTGVGAAVVGGGELLKRKKKKILNLGNPSLKLITHNLTGYVNLVLKSK